MKSNFNAKLVLETPRLILRLLTASDLDALASFYGDPEVMQFIGSGATRTREETEKSIRYTREFWEINLFGMWGVVLKSENKLIGRAGLTYLDNNPEIELGYLLGKPYWGKGYATEAALACIQFGFECMAFKKIVGVTLPHHTTSQRVLEKVGMSLKKQAFVYGVKVNYFALEKT